MTMLISKKQLTDLYLPIYKVGYCDLQDLFGYNPEFSGSGIYGWNWSAWLLTISEETRPVALLCHGYRQVPGKPVPKELVIRYKDLAKKVLDSYGVDKWTKLEKLRQQFIKELLTFDKEGYIEA